MCKNTDVLDIRGCVTVTGETRPNLRDKDAPHFGLRLSASCLCLLLEVKHPLAQRYEIGDEMAQGRRVWLGKHR